MAEVRVLVVSPNPLARSGLASLLVGIDGLKLVGSGGVAQASSLAGQLLPDVMLLDVGEGELEDLDSIARLAAGQPGLPIVALAADQSLVGHALSFGASALLPSAVDRETLRAAVVAAVQGLVSVTRRDLAGLLPAEEEPVATNLKTPVESLTARELEVVQLMAQGLTNRQIARKLEISEHTVKFHAAAVLGKLAARSRTEAVARAIAQGWLLV